jgi:hypothetical protein
MQFSRLFVRRHLVWAATGIGWVGAVTWGSTWLWRYESVAGTPADAPLVYPADPVSRGATSSLPRLILIAHPRCPCTRATISELAALMTRCRGKVAATVLLVQPPGAPAGWERSGIAAAASAIPDVNVVVDEDGRQARQLGAATSGQALLYGADGRLLFSGGITESRGHAGDNAGRAAITALILNQTATDALIIGSTPVYGCRLLDADAASFGTAGESCQK